MGFSEKKIFAVVGIILVILAVGLAIGLVARHTVNPQSGATSPTVPMYNGRVLNDIYNPTVPQNAAPTNAQQVTPASTDPNLSTRSRLYAMSASASGFSPNSITVNEYDTVRINFTAADGDYDFSIPYLGVNFSTVPKGMTKLLMFNASGAGVFGFECNTACPQSGKIKGTLTIIPYKP